MMTPASQPDYAVSSAYSPNFERWVWLLLGVLQGQTIRALRAARSSPGQEAYRIRRGTYRIVYATEDDRMIVMAVKVGHCRDVYK
jgi:mRNA-degrading endonuclease RelE of RelBE toxin-antitoxin system